MAIANMFLNGGVRGGLDSLQFNAIHNSEASLWYKWLVSHGRVFFKGPLIQTKCQVGTVLMEDLCGQVLRILKGFK